MTKQRINLNLLSSSWSWSPFQPTHWPAFNVQEDRAAAFTEGLADGGQAERGGESVRVRAHGAVPTHFVRQLAGALVALLPRRGQLLLVWGGIRSRLYHQAVALCGGAAGDVPLLVLVFLLGCWVTGVGSGRDSWFETPSVSCNIDSVTMVFILQLHAFSIMFFTRCIIQDWGVCPAYSNCLQVNFQTEYFITALILCIQHILKNLRIHILRNDFPTVGLCGVRSCVQGSSPAWCSATPPHPASGCGSWAPRSESEWCPGSHPSPCAHTGSLQVAT